MNDDYDDYEQSAKNVFDDKALLKSGIIINKQTKNTRITNHATLYIKFIRSFCACAHAGTGRTRKREYIMSCSDLILFSFIRKRNPFTSG